MNNLKSLRRLRACVLVTVLLGIGSSIVINVLHAPGNIPARFVAALPPLAVFGALELITRIPSSGRALSVFRIGGAVVVAGGAATISYAQQMAAIIGLGFPVWEARVWPSIIDGMMIVAAVSLVEVVRRIRQLSDLTEMAPSSPARLRVVADQQETPQVLAYREAARRLREDSALAALNGGRAA